MTEVKTPNVINIFDVAKNKTRLEGMVKVAQFEELLGLLANDEGQVSYQIEGKGDILGLPAVKLSLEAQVFTTCARCLKPVSVTFESERTFVFTKTEAQANQMPIDEDEENMEVAVGSERMGLLAWMQEELILSLPPFVTHEFCQTEEIKTTQKEEPSVKKENPFAVLKDLKKH